MKNNFLEQTIVKHLAGSQAYGTSTPESDTDYRGIFLANKEYILTPFFNVKEVSDTSEEDTKFYEINQYLSLYTEANPNILESLWVKPEHIVESTEIYDYLRSFNQQLLSSKIAHSYSGYAYNQVKRMSNHHGWLDKERIAERKLNEILEEHPVDEVLSWMYDTFPQYLVDRLNKSNLHPFNATKIDFEKYMRDTSLQLVSTQALKQYHFVRLVHNYSTDKVLDRDFNLLNYNSGYELIHYGENIFGVIINPNESTLNADGSLRYFNKERTSEELKVRPELIVKFNEKEYKENSENRKSYHKWKQNRNAKRAILESHHGYDCYSFDTEFLTKDGWKLFDDITENDLLATFDKNHKVEYQKYTERFDNLYNGNLYHFTGHHQDTLVTANHRMYVKDYARNQQKDMSDWKFVEAAQLKETYKILNTISPITKEHKDKKSPIDYMDIKVYLQLMGWFISDGCINFRDGKVKSLYISQSKTSQGMRCALSKYKKSGQLMFNEYIIEKKDYQANDESRYTFPSEVAEALYNDCGHGSYNKRIPNWVFDLTKRKMDFLLKGLLQGDGTKRNLVNDNDTFVYYTANSLLADDVQKLALLCGYETSKWGPYTNETNFGSVDIYQIHINMKPKTEKMNMKQNLEKIPVTNYRTVCFSVPNGTLITRRNGKTALHGNCKHAMHTIRLLNTAEEALETGIIQVHRPDAAMLMDIRNGKWLYQEVMDYFNEKVDYIRNVAYHKTHLPKRPNIKLATKVLLDIREMQWYSKK